MSTFTKKHIIPVLLCFAMLCAIAGCGPKGGSDAFSSGTGTQSGAQDPGFIIPGEAAVGDFDWAFNPRAYDSSGEVFFEDPFAAVGTWEMVIWRKAYTKQQGAQKEVYWINIALEARNGKMLINPDINAYQAFLNSDEAKSAGIQGNDTASRLLEAFAVGDGSVKAQATIVLAGIEDNDGNWKSSSGKPVQLEGKYYPEATFIKLADKKGNEFTANNFLSIGDDQHAIGAFTPAGNKMGLHGAVYLYRKIK